MSVSKSMKFHEIQDQMAFSDAAVVKGADAKIVKRALGTLRAVRWVMGLLILVTLCFTIPLLMMLDSLKQSEIMLAAVSYAGLILLVLAGVFGARAILHHLHYVYSKRDYQVEIVEVTVKEVEVVR